MVKSSNEQRPSFKQMLIQGSSRNAPFHLNPSSSLGNEQKGDSKALPLNEGSIPMCSGEGEDDDIPDLFDSDSKDTTSFYHAYLIGKILGEAIRSSLFQCSVLWSGNFLEWWVL